MHKRFPTMNITKALYLLIGLFLSTTLCSCVSETASAPANAANREAPAYSNPYSTPSPVRHKQIHSTAPTPPVWINEMPDDTALYHFEVGLSDFSTSESSARETAMKGARAAYARYTGVNISEIDEVAKYLEGRESDVHDATIAGSNKQTQKTDAEVSRIKAKSYYIEKFEDTRDSKYIGTSYKCWVLVTIPVDEMKKVEEWRKRKGEIEQAAISRKKVEAEKALANLKDNQQEIITLAHKELEDGRLISALGIVQQQKHVLSAAKDRFLNGHDQYKACLTDVKLLDIELTNTGRKIIGQLSLDPGRFGAALLQANKNGDNVSVWAWLQTDQGLVPASGLPLALTTNTGVVLSSAIAQSNGKAVFFLPPGVVGPMSVKIDATAQWVDRLSPELQDGLALASCRLNILPVGGDLSRSIEYAVQNLFADSAQVDLVVEQVLMGPMTYHTSGIGSEFSEVLKKQLRRALKEVDGLVLIEPRQRNIEQINRAVKTRGISLVAGNSGISSGGHANTRTYNTSNAKNGPSIGSSAMQAVMEGAQASLEGTYVVRDDGVQLDLSLHQASTDIVMAASNVKIPRGSIDRGIKMIPDQNEIYDFTAPQTPNSINVEITSDYGNGQTYMAGDKVSYFAHIDRDAYLLMVYQDAGGNLLQIFPNSRSSNRKFRASTTIQVPSQNDSFEFEIMAPFGREQVFAFASTEKFPALPGNMHDSGLKILDVSLNRVFEILRRNSSRSDRGYGEAITSLTTVARKQSY